MQEIICVLDKSASMGSVAEEAKAGFNKFIKAQQEVGEANITIVFFDDAWELFYSGKLSECQPLGFWPIMGMTALHDAIGKTINHVRERFSKEKPEKVIMAILTDGHENCSKEFTRESVAKLIKHHQDEYAWEVIFLAADQDAWAAAQHLNIKKADAYSVTKRAMGQSIGHTYSSAVIGKRTT